MTFFKTSIVLAGYATAIQITKKIKEFEFNEWSLKFNKSYSDSTERSKRLQNWLKHEDEVALINSDPKHTFKLGQNKFSDWDKEEYLAFLGDRDDNKSQKLAQVDSEKRATVLPINNVVLADATTIVDFDWLP